MLPALAEEARQGRPHRALRAAGPRRQRAAGVPVVHCTAETRADRKGANRNARLFAGIEKSSNRIEPGSDAVLPPAEIGVDPGDLVLPRLHGIGPMTGTQLDPVLRNLGVSTIVGVGVSLNIGMLNLAFDGVNHGYQVVIPADAVAGVPADYAAAILQNTMRLVATVTSTADVLRAWGTTLEPSG